MKRLFVLSWLVLFLCSCAANRKSQFRANEITSLELNKVSTDDEFSPAVDGGVLSILLPKLIDWGVPKIKSIFEKEATNYVAEYQASLFDDQFYKEIDEYSQNRPLNYSGFTLHRIIAPSNKSKDTVATITIDFIQNKHKTFLAFQPQHVLIGKSKAKLRKNDSSVDLVVDIRLTAAWVNQKKEHRNEEIASVQFPLKNIVLGKEYTADDEELAGIQSQWFAPIPISLHADGQHIGDGNVGIEVTVTEIDDFGEKLKNYSKEIEAVESSLQELLKSMLNE